MFGFGCPEFLILFIVLTLIAAMVKKEKLEKGPTYKCLSCGFEGPMKTWLRNHSFPQLILIVLCLFYLIPGIIFWVWASGKRKCPRCGALDKNMMLSHQAQDGGSAPAEKKCPFCAETVKSEAIVCKHCGRDLPSPAWSSQGH